MVDSERAGGLAAIHEEWRLGMTGVNGGQQTLPELVAAAGAGSPDAWNAIVDRFTPLLWAICRGHRLGHADAADVVQIT